MHVRPLSHSDASAFCALRVRALIEHPEAFGRTPEEVDPVAVWAERLRVDAESDLDCLLGAFDGDRLVAVAGCHRERAVKQRHIVHIWGVYVVPEHRRTGLGRRIFTAAVDHATAWQGVEQIWLDVTTVNTGARALYASCGFRSVAIKPRSLKIGDRYYDEELMALSVDPRSARA